MNRLEELRAKLAKLTSEMRSITDNATGEVSVEQNARFDTLKVEADAIQKQIERAAVVDDLERRAGGTQITGTGDARFDDLCNRVSLTRALASTFDSRIEAGLEREVSTELQRRTGQNPQGILVPHSVFLERRDGQVAANFADGGALVPDSYRPDLIIDRLRAASILAQLGVTVLTGLMGRVVIPKITGSTGVEWIGENEEPTGTKMTFGQMAVSPKTVAGQAAMSRSLLMNSNPSIESLVRNDIAKIVAEAVDLAAIEGTGVKDPKGLLNYSELPLLTRTGADNGKAVTADELIDMTAGLDIANSLNGNLKWLTNPKVVREIMKIVDGEERYIFLDKLPASLLSYPVGRSTNVPSDLVKASGSSLSALIFADWSSMITGYWGGLDVLANPYSEAAKGQVLIHVFQDVDVGIRHFESFIALKDVVTEA